MSPTGLPLRIRWSWLMPRMARVPENGCQPIHIHSVRETRMSNLLESPRHVSGLRATEEILAATAHDLRLPLSHIKGFVTSLRRTDVEWDDETRSEFMAEIDLETDRLAGLVESLLAVRAPDGSYTPGPDLTFVHPAAVVDGALHRVRGLIGDRRLRIDVPLNLPSVRIDASQMERVLANLLQNALKYSPPGTPIGVSARTTGDGELELSVEDEGPGIAVEDRERIFEPFFRKQTAQQSSVPGHGLGLAICQSIVLAHGGRMQVTDRPAGGARFSVFLPAQVPAKQFDRSYQPKDRGDEPATDPAKHSRCGRRGADAQAPRQQSQGQRLRGALGSGWCGGVETHRGVPIRPAAA
jgi:two-component system, OmpR family, sensor histidine kinase KdpD